MKSKFGESVPLGCYTYRLANIYRHFGRSAGVKTFGETCFSTQLNISGYLNLQQNLSKNHKTSHELTRTKCSTTEGFSERKYVEETKKKKREEIIKKNKVCC
jgi:hypothetical protein